MSLGHNGRLRQLLALVKSGELQRARAESKTVAEWAARVGMTGAELRAVIKRAQAAGHAVPRWSDDTAVDGAFDTSEFDDEEPTIPGDYQTVEIDIGKTDKSPPIDPIPAGHRIRGVSTFVDPDGSIKGQWIKTSAVNDERADWLDAVRSIADELPRFEPTVLPGPGDDELLTVYPVGDPHIGLLAWHEDAGENFDMDIAERNLVSAFAHLTNLAPRSAEALLIFVGDNAHADSQSNQTTKGTRVDVDSRTIKMARRVVRVIRRSIDLVLAKHRRARLIVERGNHDELLSAMIALALSLLYENEPRVSVDTSPEMYHWFRFGSVLIGTHHGDKAKPMDMLGVMAVDRAADWSSTKHRRIYCGHFHHEITKEVPGMLVHYLPTLASSDAWHRAMGYRSQRAMYMDVYDREHGHVNRHYVGIEQVAKRAV